MIGLMIKDFVNLKKNIRMFMLVTIVYGFMAYSSGDASFFSSIFTMLIAMLTLSAYSYDEMAKWDVYALTLPVSREDVVRGKYAIMLSLTFLGSIVSMAFTIVLNIILGSEELMKGVTNCWIGAAIVILFYSIALPFITKAGVEKARIIIFAIYIIPFVIVYLLNQAVKEKGIRIPESLINIGVRLMDNINVLLPLFLLFALAVSYTISSGIYCKKEF